MFKFEPSLSPGRVMPVFFTSLILAACTQMPAGTVEKTVDKEVETCAAPAVTTRNADDVQRIDELQHESSDLRVQLHELRRQMFERRRQFLEERQRLEQELKEVRERADDLQNKLDAVLAVDRDLRRGGKIPQ